MTPSAHFGAHTHYDQGADHTVACGRDKGASIFTAGYERLTCPACWHRVWTEAFGAASGPEEVA